MPDLRLGIDARQARRGAGAFNNALDKVNRKTRQTDRATRRAAGGLTKFGGAARLAAGAFALIGLSLGIREFTRLSDSFTNVGNRLRLVTKNSEEFAAVQAEIIRQANANFQTLDAQAELFQRVAKGAGAAGFSTREALQATNAVAKAIRLSGVSAMAAEAAITQFGQGLAAGALRGDELRSVLEQTPRLAQAIADALGAPIGKLRELGEAGLITVDKLIPGLIEQIATLDAELKTFAPTIDEGFTRLKNALVTSIGDFNEVSGTAKGFGNILSSLGTLIEDNLAGALLVFQVNFGQLFSLVKDGAAGIVIAFDAITGAIGDSTGATEGLGDTLLELLKDTIPNLVALVQIFSTELIGAIAKATRELSGFFSEATSGFQILLKSFQLADAQLEEAAEGLRGDELRQFIEGNAERVAGLRGEIEQLANSEAAAASAREAANKRDEDFRLVNITAILAQRTASIDERKVAASAARQRQKDREEALKGIKDLIGVAGGAAGVAGAVQALSKEIQKLIAQTRTPIQEFVIGFTELTEAIAKGLPLENATRGIADLLNTLAGSTATLGDFRTALDQALASGVDPTAIETFREFGLTTDELQKQLAAFQMLNPAATVGDYVAALTLAKDAISETLTAQENYNLAQAEFQKLLTAGIISAPEFENILKNLQETLLDQTDVMTEFAVQAARNIQSAFADFLFDPFEDGLRGLAFNFAQTLRKIAADILANIIIQQFFKSLSGVGGPIGDFAKLALGSSQAGQPIGSRETRIVGERGPELFSPRTSGNITRSSETMQALMPTINNTVIVDPRGFTEALATPVGGRDLVNAITVNKNAIKAALQ